MSLSATQKAALAASVDTLTAQITALVVDPEINPLQPLLDAALAERDTALAANLVLQDRIAIAKVALQAVSAADAVEDLRRAEAIAALG